MGDWVRPDSNESTLRTGTPAFNRVIYVKLRSLQFVRHQIATPLRVGWQPDIVSQHFGWSRVDHEVQVGAIKRRSRPDHQGRLYPSVGASCRPGPVGGVGGRAVYAVLQTVRSTN